MDTAVRRTRHWTATWLAVFTLTASLAIAIAAPSTASACAVGPCPVDPSAAPAVQLAGLGHTGWTYLELNYCIPTRCPAPYRASVAAWKWTNTGWAASSIRGGWIYVAPFGSGYRWAWTQASGWVAISGQKFEIRAY